MTFEFSFREMVNWYDDSKDNTVLFENDKKTVAFFIEKVQKYEQVSSKQIKKRGLKDIGKDSKDGYKCQFVKQHVAPDNIRRIKFLQDDIFEYGIYYVKQDENNVFFVSPEIKKTKYSDETFISGDHFSFPFIPKKKEIHLHMTTYTPLPTDIHIGQITHNPRNVFADKIMMPTDGYDTRIFDNMGGSKNYILDMCRAHVQHKEQDGGGKSRKAKTATATAKSACIGVTLELERLLIKLKVERVVAFGYKVDENTWNIMVDIDLKSQNDFSFTLKKPHFGLFQNRLVSKLKSL